MNILRWLLIWIIVIYALSFLFGGCRTSISIGGPVFTAILVLLLLRWLFKKNT